MGTTAFDGGAPMRHETTFRRAVLPGVWEPRDWGFGVSWCVGPGEGLVGALMTQRRLDTLGIPSSGRDAWPSAYQPIED